MESSLAELRARPHTSISALRTLLRCPRQFRLQYIDRIPPAFRSAAMAFGSAWHEVIDEWLVRPEVTTEELRDRLRDELSWRLRDHELMFDDEEESEETFVDKGVAMLDVFLEKIARPEKTIGVELAFALELGHPVTGEILPVKFIGAMDALVIDNGRETIWELKTGKRKWGPDQLEFDLQTTSYEMAARELGHDDVDLRLLLTTKGQKPDVQSENLVRHRRDERELVETVFSVHRAVQAGVDHPVRGWQCKTCAWAGACGA